MIDIMNTPEQYVLFGLISIIVIIIVIAYMWSKVQRRRVQDAMEDIDSRPDNRRKRSREMLDRLIETKQQIAQNQTIVQTLIEARDEARCRLTSMERKYQTMYENAGIGIARLDATYRYIEVNQYYAQIYGYESPETFMDMNPFFAYVCPFFHHNHEHMLLHESKTMIKNDCHHVARDDVSIVVRNTFVPVLSENGDVEFYDLFSENVTEETRTRQELEQSNRALDAEARKRAEKIITMEREHTKLYNTAPVGLYRAEIHSGVFIFVNDYMAHMLGYKSVEECLMHTMNEHYVEVSDQHRFTAAEGEETPTHRVTVHWSKAHTHQHIWLILTEVINFNQGYVEGVAIDVSNETIAQNELMRAKEQYRLVYERAPVGLYQISAATGRFEMWNTAMRSILGYDVNTDIDKINMNEHVVSFRNRPKSQETTTNEIEIITAAGETRWLSITETLCENDTIYEGFAIDITKQRLAEQQLNALYVDYMRMYKSAPVGYAPFVQQQDLFSFR